MRGNLVSAARVELVATALPASAQRAGDDHDRAFDLAAAKTFRPEAETPVADPFSHRRIVDAVAGGAEVQVGPETREERIQKAAREIFESFPQRAKK